MSGVEHQEIVRLYGPWARRTPRDATDLLDGYAGSWWVAGGWAIEAFTGIPRPHGDLDLSIPRSEVPSLRAHLRDRLDVWAADRGSLRPITVDDDGPPTTCSNLWLRPSGADPWEYDVILMDVSEGVWTYKRNPRVSLHSDGLLWERDGVRFLRPEIQLLHKAPGLRPQDQSDFDAALPRLTRSSRSWLTSALEAAHPDHPWIAALLAAA